MFILNTGAEIMKRIYLIILVILLAYPAFGQAVRKLRIIYDPEQTLYTLQFNIKPDKKAPDKHYKVILTVKNDELVMHPTTATGSGLYYPIPSGNGYRISWNPVKEDLDPRGWGFHLKLQDPNPAPPTQEKNFMDHPLVIVVSYLFVFSTLYLINVLNR